MPTGTTAKRHFEAVYSECLASLPNRVEQIKTNCASVFEALEADAERCRQAEEAEDISFRLDGKKAVYKQTSDPKKCTKTFPKEKGK